MSYKVLARRYRSRTFEDVVGQEPIATTLRNAIKADRVAHGYLFCGTRGVGKTSMARILAKALNCQASDAPTTTPCGQCDSCQAVAEGQDVDVVEIDGASNNSVENVRDLRSNAIYRPTRARYKIYIIDEVHMLSTGAFNALLKTLEEPPEHVKFIFATTEVQKVPLTIQSRCQRFDFRSIGADKIAGLLLHVLESEKIEADDDAVRRIARLANGSMRDGLSVLDQVLSLGEKKLTLDLIEEMLPTPHQEQVESLVSFLADADAAGAIRTVEDALNEGLSFEQFCATLLGHLRSLMLLATCGGDTDLVDVPSTVRASMSAQSARFDSGTYVYMITVIEELRRSVRFSGSGRALIDAAVVRLAHSRNFSSLDALLGQLRGGPASAPPPQAAPKKKN